MLSNYLRNITVILFCFSLLNTLLFSTSAQASDLHKMHSLMGSHGMVLMYNEKEGFFASHLPLYSTPHNYQLIYKIKTDKPEKLIELIQNDMVTLLPDNFDLSRLVNGESFSINTAFFQGHFERGGKQKFTSKMTFEKPILIEKVSTTYSDDVAAFYNVAVSENTAIFAHRIQRSPSFDAIGFIGRNELKDIITKNATDKTIITESKNNTNMIMCNKPFMLKSSKIKPQLESCAKFELKYIETQDFK